MLLFLFACMALLSGCSHSTDKLVGQWNGPEGTYLKIAGVGGKYAITIRNLDGARTFDGQGAGDAIQFQRDDRPELIRTTDGAGTGMKWLRQKKDCIVVHPGEGYCRG